MKIQAKHFKYLLVVAFFIGSFFVWHQVLAQAQADIQEGITQVDNTLQLSNRDPRIMATRIINVALGFLALISLVLVLFGGYLYMTSGGDEQKISSAKAVLKNAAIGLAIILASWGITTFVLDRLGWATGLGRLIIPPTPKIVVLPGASALGACRVDSVYPEPASSGVPRNTSIMVTFKEEVELETICFPSTDANGKTVCDPTQGVKTTFVKLFLRDDNVNNICTKSTCASEISNLRVMTSDSKTFIFYLDGAAGTDLLGFDDKDSEYTMYIARGVSAVSNGKSIFDGCNSDNLLWDFSVGTLVDFTPPIVAIQGAAPAPDFQADTTVLLAGASQAQGTVTFYGEPTTAEPATLASGPTPLGPGIMSDVTVTADCREDAPLAVNIEEKNGVYSALLQKDSGGGNFESLGVSTLKDDGAGKFAGSFSGYFAFKIDRQDVGDAWKLQLNARKNPDTLIVADKAFTFVAVDNGAYQIAVDETVGTAQNAAAAINEVFEDNNPDKPNVVIADTSNGKLIIKSGIAGSRGNNIPFDYILGNQSDASMIGVSPQSGFLGGGSDEDLKLQVHGVPDHPRNTVIQIRFNKAINPIGISGKSGDVRNQIRVVNDLSTAVSEGEACVDDYSCKSFKCNETTRLCAGNELAGKFIVSNQYKIIEFISDNQCGVNGCGEKIYCLPENSTLRVEMRAASLGGVSECSTLRAYPTMNSDMVCQNANGHNYPRSDMSLLDGIMDAALNSLDGDRDTYAEGNISAYDESVAFQVAKEGVGSVSEGDSYTWYFYVNDKIELGAPSITAITPANGKKGVGVTDEISVDFSKIMMSSSLTAGSVLVINEKGEEIRHKRVNLWSDSRAPFGYWIAQEFYEYNDPSNGIVPDGIEDWTRMVIKHSPLPQSVSLHAQVGSGVKDIYQNCYKPSSGPACTVTDLMPSCCYGTATDALNPKTGNCQ